MGSQDWAQHMKCHAARKFIWDKKFFSRDLTVGSGEAVEHRRALLLLLLLANTALAYLLLEAGGL